MTASHPDWISLGGREALAQETAAPAAIMLLTLTDPASPGTPVRICSAPARRLTIDPLVYGLRSRGHDYLYLPISIRMPSDEQGGQGQTQVRLHHMSSTVLSMVRQIQPKTTALIEVVMPASPDEVEMAVDGLEVIAAPWDGRQVTLTLSPVSLSREAWPAGRITPTTFPGAFR